MTSSSSPASLRSAWSGRTVFLTGHTGFKGAWMTAWLRRLGARVVGFSLPADAVSLFRAARLDDGIVHVEGDIRDVKAVRAAMVAHAPDAVFHLAAQSLVRLSYDEPVDTFATNVIGTVNVLEACRASPQTRAVVVVTTDKCYENREWPWAYRETDTLGGHDPYSASKACAELATAAYRGSFFSKPGAARIATVRAGNVIGGGDWAKDRIIPDIVRAAMAKTATSIRNPAAVRPWQHVLEPLAGYLGLGARLLDDDGGSFADAWNFGPRDDEPVPVSVIAQRFVAQLGRGTLNLMTPDPNAPKETKLLRVDSTKARTTLAWRPQLSVTDAVDLTAAWYRAFLDDEGSARAVLDAQIAAYDEKLRDS